ncbi:hypothetical protein GCM10027048_42300 [Hymenobacter coalescens]
MHTSNSVIWDIANRRFDAHKRFEFAKAAYDAEVARAWNEYVQTFKAYRAAGINFNLSGVTDTLVQETIIKPSG